jgi:hypothetical protein
MVAFQTPGDLFRRPLGSQAVSDRVTVESCV